MSLEEMKIRQLEKRVAELSDWLSKESNKTATMYTAFWFHTIAAIGYLVLSFLQTFVWN